MEIKISSKTNDCTEGHVSLEECDKVEVIVNNKVNLLMLEGKNKLTAECSHELFQDAFIEYMCYMDNNTIDYIISELEKVKSK